MLQFCYSFFVTISTTCYNFVTIYSAKCTKTGCKCTFSLLSICQFFASKRRNVRARINHNLHIFIRFTFSFFSCVPRGTRTLDPLIKSQSRGLIIRRGKWESAYCYKIVTIIVSYSKTYSVYLTLAHACAGIYFISSYLYAHLPSYITSKLFRGILLYVCDSAHVLISRTLYLESNHLLHVIAYP